MKSVRARCFWVKPENKLYAEYHDNEWGRPVHDDRLLFEMLILEGAQAGLSWETVLKKRQNYKKAFAGFDPKKVAKFSAKDAKRLMKDPGIIRNRLKIESTISNAKSFLGVQKEFGSFDKYIWNFVGGKPKKNRFKSRKDYVTRSEISDAISKDLKRRGFRFVGTTIIYAYMQAVGLVNDHTVGCFLHK